MPVGIKTPALLSVIFFVGVISACIFLGYAFLFSSPVIRARYVLLAVCQFGLTVRWRFVTIVFAVVSLYFDNT